MADETPPRNGGNPLKDIGGFIKKNRVPVVLAGGAGAFLWLSNKGAGGGEGPTPSTYGTIVPVMRELGENNEDSGDVPGSEVPGYEDPILGADPDLPAEPPLPSEPPLPDEDPKSPNVSAPVQDSPTATAQPPAPTKVPSAAATESGVSINGVVIPGATSRQMTGTGTNRYGKYSDWFVRFPGGSGHYFHYYEDEHGRPKDKVTGPHDPKGTIPAGAKVADDAPTSFTGPSHLAPAAVPTPPPGMTATNPTPVGNPAPGTTNTWIDYYLWQTDGDVHIYRIITAGPGAGTVGYRGKTGNYGRPPSSLSATLQGQGWTKSGPFLIGKGPYQKQIGFGQG